MTTREIFDRTCTESWSMDLFDRFEAALHAAGYKIVTREPTEAMITAGWWKGHDVTDIYRAMWDAAP